MQFQISCRRETGKEIPESSRLEVLERFSANDFALSDAEHHRVVEKRKYSTFTFVENTNGNLQKLARAKFLGSDGLFCFMAYVSLAASRTFLQQLLACLNFTLDSEDLSFGYKRKM